MGRSFASLFTSRAPARGFVGPTDRPLNSNNVPETSWARGSSRSKSSRPLINLNAPTNSAYPSAPRARSEWTPMSPKTKGRVLNGRRIQLGLRVLALLGAIGSLFCAIIITHLPASIVWIMRVGPAVAILHTLYGIYQLSRSPIGKPPGIQANYMLFASTFDLGLIPFYVFAAYISYIEYANTAYNWGTLLGNMNGIPHLIANVAFILGVVNGTLHAVSFVISMSLGIIFRRITRLPPDMNPLEDNLTARPHKRTKSEIAEKHLSQSTVDSGIGMDDPLIGSPRTMPFSMHARHQSSGDGLDDFVFNENRLSQGPFVHPDQLPYADPVPKPLQFQQRPIQHGNVIPRKPVQSSKVPTQNTDNVMVQPTPPAHLDVPGQEPYPADMSDRSKTVSPMSDNWIAYPSRSPSPLDNLQVDNVKNENVARRDISSMYSRSNTTASTDSAPKDWVASAQRYGWNIGETITEDVRGEYESIAMHEYYGHDDDYVNGYPQQNGLYDAAERDLGDQRINIYVDDNLSDEDDDKDDKEPATLQLLNPLALNPPTPQTSRHDLHDGNRSNPTNGRHALADIPNLSPSPNLRPDTPPPGDSPEKKTGRYYGELESNPSISIRHDRDASDQSTPLRKKSKLTKKNNKSKKMSSYGALRQDDHVSDDENDSDGSPALPQGADETDRKGRVVSNSGADIPGPRRSNVGAAASAGLSSYGNYIAGLGIGVGRRRDVSGKMAEEGRSGTMVNAGRPGTEPEHKKPIRAAGWARFAGL